MRLTRRALLLSLAIAVASQIAWAGGHHSGSGSVHVRGYYRKDGTYVQSYDRAAPGAASASYPTSTPSTLGPSATPNLSTQTSVYAPATSSALPRTPVSVTSTAPSYIAATPDPATTYHVHGYYRSDGTYVQEYVRSAPGTVDTVV